MSIDPAGPSRFGGHVPQHLLHERSRCLAAAEFARRVYPGPLGLLLHRELTAYADLGFRFGDGLLAQLVSVVLATPSAGSGDE